MATTTNYAWETPDDTDLVKDGAAAIRTLGSSIDTTTKALNPSTTLGDIEYRSSTANTNTRLGIGSTGQVLTVSGGVPAWAAAPASDSYTTLVSPTAFGSVASVTISSISSSYKKLVLVLSNISTAANATIYVEPNPTPSGQLSGVVVQGNGGYVGTLNESGWNATARIVASAAANTSAVFEFPNYNLATAKIVSILAASYALDGNIARVGAGAWFNTDTINALKIYNDSSTTFDSGTYALYGVK